MLPSDGQSVLFGFVQGNVGVRPQGPDLARGGFYSAEDADSEGEEGKFYLWSLSELKDVLGEKDASFFAGIYGFEKEGNFLDEATREKNGGNIPHLQAPLSELAEKQEMKPAEFLAKLEKLRKKLLRAGRRIHPRRTTKCSRTGTA